MIPAHPLIKSLLAGLIAVGAILFAGCGSPPPRTPAGIQAGWLLRAARHLPISGADVAAHFDGRFIRLVNPAQLNASLAAVGGQLQGAGPVQLKSITTDTPRRLVADLSRGSGPPVIVVSLDVDIHGLIDGLRFKPYVPHVAANWCAIDAAVRSVAPDVRWLVADTTRGGCTPIDSLGARADAPLASTFKLYVLDALGKAVSAGKLGWDQLLTVTSANRSLPSGDLQDLPDGVAVSEVADKMTSLSDNTAADMLTDDLGRSAVVSSMAAAGAEDLWRDRPFLTTREAFTITLEQWPSLAQRYAGAGRAGRRALLTDTVNKLPLPSPAAVGAWRQPRYDNRIEWFSSVANLCRAYESLQAMSRRPGLGEIAHAMNIEPGGLNLDSSRWKSTWFKGGDEPGVLNLTYLATTRGGHSYFVGVLAQNRRKAINQTRAAEVLQSAIRAAFTLAASGQANSRRR